MRKAKWVLPARAEWPASLYKVCHEEVCEEAAEHVVWEAERLRERAALGWERGAELEGRVGVLPRHSAQNEREGVSWGGSERGREGVSERGMEGERKEGGSERGREGVEREGERGGRETGERGGREGGREEGGRGIASAWTTRKVCIDMREGGRRAPMVRVRVRVRVRAKY